MHEGVARQHKRISAEVVNQKGSFDYLNTDIDQIIYFRSVESA